MWTRIAKMTPLHRGLNPACLRFAWWTNVPKERDAAHQARTTDSSCCALLHDPEYASSCTQRLRHVAGHFGSFCGRSVRQKQPDLPCLLKSCFRVGLSAKISRVCSSHLTKQGSSLSIFDTVHMAPGIVQRGQPQHNQRYDRSLAS